MIWSALKSVCLRDTVMPLLSFSSVVPKAVLLLFETILPDFGMVVIRLAATVFSSYGVMVEVLAMASMPASISIPVGSTMPGVDSGPIT